MCSFIPDTSLMSCVIISLVLMTVGNNGNSNTKNQVPAFIRNPRDCPLNACEVLRIISQHFLLLKPVG